MRRMMFTLAMLTITAYLHAQTWNDDFEGGIGDWDISNGVWEVGIPTSGPNNAHGGSQCAATVLAGNYVDPSSTHLISPEFTVPAAITFPRLRFWHWYSFSSGDFGKVQIKEKGSSTWIDISPNYVNTGSGVWTCPAIDLSSYAGKTVQINFYFYAYPVNGFQNVSTGWYIDDIKIITGNPIWNKTETWEAGLGNWYAENGFWEVGHPTSGPDSAYKGTNCAATILADNYVDPGSSRLISPEFIVPAITDNPRLRFWHWYSFSSGDLGKVQIKIKDSTTWITVSPDYINTGGNVWTKTSIDLKAYAGKIIQIAFYFYAHPVNGFQNVSTGWYIDEIEIVTGIPVINNLETWESGLGDWSASNGFWEVGKPTSGPDLAYKGTNCAATVLANNYVDPGSSVLISPEFKVPATNYNPRLRFWHWYSFSSGDLGKVLLKIKDSTNWITVSPDFINTGSGVWTRTTIDLIPYANMNIQIGFYFYAYPVNGFQNVSSGWYIDEIEIVPKPTVVLVKDTAICKNTNITLTAYGSGGAQPYTYKWSNDSLRRDVTCQITRDTTISVIMNDINGWSSSDTIHINALSIPVFSILPNDTLDNSSVNKGSFIISAPEIYNYVILPSPDSAHATAEGKEIFVSFTEASKVYMVEASHTTTSCKIQKSVVMNNINLVVCPVITNKPGIYPNPVTTNSICLLKIPKPGVYQIQISGTNGQIFYTDKRHFTGNNDMLNVSMLTNGTYILTIRGKDRVETFKMVVFR